MCGGVGVPKTLPCRTLYSTNLFKVRAPPKKVCLTYLLQNPMWNAFFFSFLKKMSGGKYKNSFMLLDHFFLLVGCLAANFPRQLSQKLGSVRKVMSKVSPHTVKQVNFVASFFFFFFFL